MNQIKKQAALYLAKMIGVAIGTSFVVVTSIQYIGLAETALLILCILLVNLAFFIFNNKVQELEHIERMKERLKDRIQEK